MWGERERPIHTLSELLWVFVCVCVCVCVCVYSLYCQNVQVVVFREPNALENGEIYRGKKV